MPAQELDTTSASGGPFLLRGAVGDFGALNALDVPSAIARVLAFHVIQRKKAFSMEHARTALLATLSIAFCSAAVADTPLDPTASSAGVALETGQLDREITLTAAGQPFLEVNGDGGVAGVYAHVQTGPFFRASVRALSGNLDFDTTVGETDETMAFVEGRGTLGIEAGGGRFYSGAGVTYHSSEFSGIDWNTTTLYVPVGFAKANSVGEAWTARTTIEGRVSLAGEEELEDVPTVGNVTFDQGVGHGARFAMTFQHESGVSIGGFIETVQPGDTDEESGNIEAEEIANSSAGVRVGWSF